MQQSHRGYSLVELMIGMAVGLFVLASASTVMVSQLSDHRRLALETRTEQDVRAVAELMMRELRTAGNWGNAWKGMWSEANPNPIANPYGNVLINATSDEVTFWTTVGAENDLATDNEKRKFGLADGVLRRWSGSTWQPMTDPETLRISKFNVQLLENTYGMASACAKPCNGLENCPPTTTVRELRLQLDAEAVHDASVKRNLDVKLRLQADKLAGVCPP